MGPPHFRWFLQALITLCPEYANEVHIDQMLAEADEPKEALAKFLCDKKPYSKLCSTIFKENEVENPIILMQQYHYFDNVPKTFFETLNGFENEKITLLIEGCMWAYLDYMTPTDAFESVIGQTKLSSCADADQRICRWVNTIVKMHVQLAPVSSVSQHFLGLPNLRVALFHFLRDNTLLKIDDTPENNASVVISQLSSLGVPILFSDFRQSPLILMCYMYSVIECLSKIKPQHKIRCVSSRDVSDVLRTIQQKKIEVAEITDRVEKLDGEVKEISTKLNSMKRPISVLQGNKRRLDGSSINNRPQTSLANHNKRVKWDISQDMISGRPPTSLEDGRGDLAIDRRPVHHK